MPDDGHGARTAGYGLLRSRYVLAALMMGAGVSHFAVPEAYERIIPRWLGNPRGVVLASGAAEVAAGALLALPATRRAGAWATVAVLVAVFPANVQMALDGGIAGAGFPFGSPLVAWLRLPLQAPLVVWAWALTRRAAPLSA
ncbi:MAG TPA: hypothetical protein VGV63_02750 [Acidimicrobiales bacterium]|nr:hypothetical protein [Acidimicrobiales bacterium]